jgi:Fanconi anemia group M protein
MSLNEQTIYFNHPLLRRNILQFREYQKMIANSAMTKNTMVILPTALGKTIISLLVCINTLYNNREKRILILAPTRPLVNQHRNSFVSCIKLLDDQIAMVTGKIPPHARTIVWNKKTIRLVFSTPELVKNDIIEKRLSLKDFFLIVFDEAHRAVKDYAYTFIAEQYMQHCTHPLILGLTASPGSEKNKIQEICNNLFIEHLEYKTEEDADVKRYINLIDVKWKWFDLPSEYHYVKSILKTMLVEKLDWLVSRNIIKKNSRWIFKRDLISLGEQLRYSLNVRLVEERPSLYFALMQQSIALSLMHCIELIESQGFYSLWTFLNRTQLEESRSHKLLLNDHRIKEVKGLIEQLKIEHPKIEYLIKILKERFDSQFNLNGNSNLTYSASEKKSRVLVFTQYRDTAQHIVELLNKSKIKASRFVGQSEKQGDPGMKQEEQNSILEYFKEGDFNVLVATSIAEEGLDIPEVDLVVFYEPVPTEIRHIQRRGRTGRKNIGSVIILAAKDTIDQRYLDVSRKKIQKMKSVLSSTNAYLKFKPVNRMIVKPDPMTKYEIDSLNSFLDKFEERTKIESLLSSKNKILHNKILYSSDDHTMVQFKRQVERTARAIYSVVTIHGNNGLKIETLHNVLGVNAELTDAALKMLEKLKKIKIIGRKVIISDNVAKIRGQIYNIEIEKVVMGKALVLVNGEWHARLHHYDYGGPRELIRKGREFKAIGELYHDDDNLNIRVKQIL